MLEWFLLFTYGADFRVHLEPYGAYPELRSGAWPVLPLTISELTSLMHCPLWFVPAPSLQRVTGRKSALRAARARGNIRGRMYVNIVKINFSKISEILDRQNPTP